MAEGFGKIVAIVGAPATGKSTLAGSLARFTSSLMVAEASYFPNWVRQSIARGGFDIRKHMWFLSEAVNAVQVAHESSSLNRFVIMDTFWGLSYPYYLYESKLGEECPEYQFLLDSVTTGLKIPDAIIVLNGSDSAIERNWKARNAEYDSNKAGFSRILGLKETINQFFSENPFPNTLEVDIVDYDFKARKSVRRLWDHIQSSVL